MFLLFCRLLPPLGNHHRVLDLDWEGKALLFLFKEEALHTYLPYLETSRSLQDS
uniref:NAD-dependent protein deacetylase SRT2-like n=1 Tax=Rhizophora mucronata TaxID=61149 RepID=A0A2P2KFS8_RHIMU